MSDQCNCITCTRNRNFMSYLNEYNISNEHKKFFISILSDLNHAELDNEIYKLRLSGEWIGDQ